MFYSQFILAKKGPLGTIWIAAHLERKLRKNQVADTDIGVSVDSILFPEMPIALRLSSHLLLGVVRIYSKKVNYLFDDCSEALLKVKQAFRSTAVDLPPEESTAPYHSITLPETFDLDDFELPDNDLQGNYVDQHISSKDQITLQDTMEGVVYTTSKFGLDERFGDGDASGLDLDEELLAEKAATPELATGTLNSDDDPQASVHANDSGGTPNQDIDEYDGDNEPVDYAEAPSTPGLWEEPNLSNIQETSTCDDHQEPENHTITEFVVKENLENAPHQHHHNQLESHENSLPHVAATANDIGSTIFTESRSAEPVIPVSNDPVQVETLPSKKLIDGPPPGFQIPNDNRENFVEYQGSQENASRITTVLESNAEKDSVVSSPQHHASLGPKDTNQVPFPHASMANSDFPAIRPCVTFPSHESNGPHVTEPLIKNFPEILHAEIRQNDEVRVDNAVQREVQVENINSYTNDFSAPVIQREVQVENINNYTNDFSAPVVQREVQVENVNRYTDDFSAPVVQREVQVENINSYTNDISAPEKRLPMPHWLSDVPKNFVPESTPLETDITSGKKRTFTESSMTPHSLNLNESSGLYPTNMTSQSFNLNQSSGLFTTNTPAQSLNLNESSGFFTTNTTAQSINLNQSSGFFTTDTIAQNSNLNQSSGFFTTNTTAQNSNLNQSSGFFTTNTTAQNSNLNQPSGFFTTNTTAQNSNLNQSSGFFSTNTTAQNLNLNQSSGSFTINMSGQPVMNDDDLLSSILVGRKSSMLKSKPAPPVVTPSTKRRRSSAPKTSVMKRKVLMDDNMVLHGDTIRQQLTNTEDIRRLRKKAPCTRSEISMLEKQFWEDELFSEPIFTGVSIKLVSLHKQLYNLSKIVVSHNDASLESEKDPKSISQNVEKETQLEVRPEVSKQNANFEPVAEQPIEFPMVRDNHTHDNNTVNLDYYGSQPPQMVATEHVAKPFNSEHDLFNQSSAMEIDPKSFPDADIGVSVMPTEVEPPTHADVDHVVPSDAFDMSAAMGEVQVDADASLQTDVPVVSSSEKVDEDAALTSNFDLDINGNKSIENAVAAEINIDVAPVREMSVEKQDQDSEFRKNEEVVNEDAALTSNFESDAQKSVYNGIFGEEYGTIGAYDTEVDPSLPNVSLDERENTGHQVTFEMTEMNAEDVAADPASNRVDDDESTHPAVENNTDFLNFDDGDDDGADAGGDYGTDVEATRVINNSGWSSRTKAVARYLQVMFDKEGERGRNMIAVNNLLVGKTRKEASRMFFETLVLKTKDYIHVEQADPFGDINVFPRSKLLKSDF
ncbi:putative rad21/Rec8-like protein [Helianthus annuus]|nr:putative rad21/Rec8-like protein [Helianthus annuus]